MLTNVKDDLEEQMKNKSLRFAAFALVGTLLLSDGTLVANAASLPAAGAAVTLDSVMEVAKNTEAPATISVAEVATAAETTIEKEDLQDVEVKLSAGEAASIVGVGGVF